MSLSQFLTGVLHALEYESEAFSTACGAHERNMCCECPSRFAEIIDQCYPPQKSQWTFQKHNTCEAAAFMKYFREAHTGAAANAFARYSLLYDYSDRNPKHLCEAHGGALGEASKRRAGVC